MNRILIKIVFCLLVLCQAFNIDAKNRLVPYPNYMEITGEFLSLPQVLTWSCPKSFRSDMEVISGIFKSEFRIAFKKSKSALLNVVMDKKLDAEEYRLEIGTETVKVAASTAAGFFYAMQTFRQLVELQGDGTYHVATCKISDAPAYAFRGFMLDEGRQFCGKDVVKTLLDEMALLKMNVFQWHLTENQGWRIEIKKYPDLTEVGAWRDSTTYRFLYPQGTPENPSMGEVRYTRPYPAGGYYTQDEIREIVAYASDRHITIIPEIEMPGHSRAAIAAYPFLDASGDTLDVPANSRFEPYAFDVANPKVLQFAKDVIDEVVELFPGPIVHLGGDEIRYDSWEKSSYVSDLMSAKNYASYSDIQTDFYNRMAAYLKLKGKRLMGWNEIMGDIHTAGNSEETATDVKLDESVIVQFWTRLHTEKGPSQRLAQAMEKNHYIVNSDKRFTYFDFIHHYTSLAKVYSFSPVPEGLNDKSDKVLGLCCALWGQVIPTVQEVYQHTFPRITAIAEVGWTSSDNKDFVRFQDAVDIMQRRWDAKGISYWHAEESFDIASGGKLKE